MLFLFIIKCDMHGSRFVFACTIATKELSALYKVEQSEASLLLYCLPVFLSSAIIPCIFMSIFHYLFKYKL